MCFCSALFGDSWPQNFSNRIGPRGWSRHPGHQATATLSLQECLLLFFPNCAQVLPPLTDLLKGGPKTAQEAFQNAKHLLAAAVPFNIPPHKLSFLLPLMPPILMSVASCSRNLGTIGDHLVSFPENLPTRSLVTPRLTVNGWLHKQQSGIFAIFLKVTLFNYGQINNRL
jgi:hypothetical protein